MALRKIDLELFGGKKLVKSFELMSDKAQLRIFKRAMKEAAGPILQFTYALAPRDSGRMANSLHITPVRRSRKTKRIGSSVSVGKRSELGISEDDKYFYPAGVEFGTKNRPAVAFMRRGLERAARFALQKARAAFAKDVEKEGRKALRGLKKIGLR